jgi:hypothetical protein
LTNTNKQLKGIAKKSLMENFQYHQQHKGMIDSNYPRSFQGIDRAGNGGLTDFGNFLDNLMPRGDISSLESALYTIINQFKKEKYVFNQETARFT